MFNTFTLKWLKFVLNNKYKCKNQNFKAKTKIFN